MILDIRKRKGKIPIILIAIAFILIAGGITMIILYPKHTKKSHNPSTSQIFNQTFNPSKYPTPNPSMHPTMHTSTNPTKNPTPSTVDFKKFSSGVDVLFKKYHSLMKSVSDQPYDAFSKAFEISFLVFLDDGKLNHFRLSLDNFFCWRYYTWNKHPFFCSISSVYKHNWFMQSQNATEGANKVFVPPRNELNFFHSKMANITHNFSLNVLSVLIEIVCNGSTSDYWEYSLPEYSSHMRIDIFYYTTGDISSDPSKISIRILPESDIFAIIDRPKGISNGNDVCQFISFWQCMMVNPSLQAFLPIWHSNPAELLKNYSSIFLSSVLKRTPTSVTDDYSSLLLSIASAHLNSDHSRFLDPSTTRKYMQVLYNICSRDLKIKSFEDPSTVMGEFLEKFGIIAHLFSLQYKNVQASFAIENIYLFIYDAQQTRDDHEKLNVVMPSGSTISPDLNDMAWVDAHITSPLPKSLFFYRVVAGTGSLVPLRNSKKYEYQKIYEIKSNGSMLVSDTQKNEYNFNAKIFWTLGHYTSTILHKGKWYEVDDAFVQSYEEIPYLSPFRWNIGQGRFGVKGFENSFKSGYTGLLFQDNVALFYYQ